MSGSAQVDFDTRPDGQEESAGTSTGYSGARPSLAAPIDPLVPPERPSSNAKMLLIGMVGAGVMICAVGLFVNLTKGPQKAKAAPPPANSIFLEQQRMAREALQMAREAQELQRERLRLMQEEMRASEGYKPEKTDPSTID